MEGTVKMDEQTQAIEYSENRPALVAASAGCGKTYVLIKRLIRLISDKSLGFSADRLAAVTFTKKAAAEMKARLELAMSELLEKEPDNDYLLEQQIKLSDAKIATIDSFCLAILRENSEFLDIEPDFAMLADADSKILAKKAMKTTFLRVWNDFSEADKNALLSYFGGENVLEGYVFALSDFLGTVPDKKEWLEKQLDVYRNPAKYNEKYTEPLKRRCLETLENAGNALTELIPTENSVYFDKVKAHIATVNDTLKKLTEAIENDDTAAFLAISGASFFPRLPVTRDAALRDFADELKAANAAAKDNVKTAVELYHICFSADDDRADSKMGIELLIRVYELFDAEYTRLKREKNAVDFGDAEHLLLEMLKSDEGRKKELWRGFDCIIVDEFQDSNDVQYEIFKLLSRNEENLYFVGDIKQSIYAFRGANPRIFARLMNDSRYCRLPLNKNFRSSDAVISFTNSVFGGEMPEGFCGGLWEDMVAGRGIAQTAENTTEFIRVQAEKQGAKLKRQREAAYIAERIHTMVSDGFLVTADRDGNKRPCVYGDFAILLRGNSGGCTETIKRALLDRNIPVVTRSEKHFTDLAEINLVLAMLKIIVSPFDDLALASVLMSPLYSFSASEMAKIRLLDGVKDNGYARKNDLHSNLTLLSKSGSLDGSFEEKTERFLADFRLLRKLGRETTAADIIRKIYSHTDLIAVENVGYGGADRVANLYLLLNYAEGFAQGGESTVADFISYISEINRSDLQMEQASVSESEDASVKIVTIHGSKGLQYPVVFLACLDAEPNREDDRKNVTFDIDGGIGFNYSIYNDVPKTVRTASYEAVSAICDENVKSEELRLLYVAVTRAEEKLILTCTSEVTLPKSDDKNGEIKEAKAPKGSSLEFLLSQPKMFTQCTEKTIAYTEEIPLTSDVSSSVTSEIDIEKIRESLSYRYPYEKQTKAPAKVSATQLGVVHDDSKDDRLAADNAMYLGLPVFMKKRSRVTPKERGDIYHKVMEFLDFNAVNAEAELSRLLAENILTSDERAVVSTDDIQRFLDSSLCTRLKNADEIKREFPIFTLVNAAQIENPTEEDLSFVQGIADMFYVEHGEITLVDYKTNRNVTADELISEYKGQLSIYKKALTEMTGLSVKQCMLYSFFLGAKIPVEVTDMK